jgi:uncharacterized protein
MVMSEPVAIAILAKAPTPGFAKTRLIPALGPERAALLQARLIDRAVQTACAAAVGPVTLWITAHPTVNRDSFAELRGRHGIEVAFQSEGDLGARMLAAATAAEGCVLVIGTDCPALEAAQLRSAAATLRNSADVVLVPAEDGGYVLIGMRRAHAPLFSEMAWGTAGVIEETRRRLQDLGLSWEEPLVLWDVDRCEDIPRLQELGLGHLLA